MSSLRGAQKRLLLELQKSATFPLTLRYCSGCQRRQIHLIHTHNTQMHSWNTFAKQNARCLSNDEPCTRNNPKTVLSSKQAHSEIQQRAVDKMVKDTDFEKHFPHRARIDYSQKYTENNTITARRAVGEYLLRPSDLKDLPVISVFNPYEVGKVTDLYLRSDVEKKAVELWGSVANLMTEKQLRRKRQQMFIDKISDDLSPPASEQHWWQNFESGSGRVVKWAVAVNFVNFVAKAVAWQWTGSHSMFAEMIHSIADTLNQVILAIGIHQSIKQPDPDHPYGYSNIRYVSSLISGVGIFCLGGGLSFYHGIQGLLHPHSMEPVYWAIATLVGSVVSEGVTLMIAVKEIRNAAKHSNLTFSEYVLRGNDPHVNVVLLEDLAAVAGAGVAALAIGLTFYTGSHIPDAIGSCLVGSMLAGVAGFIIHGNSVALVGRSMPEHKQLEICDTLEQDRCVRSLLDIKTIDVGGKYYRFKAEVFFDGREITKAYMDSLEREQVDKMLDECHKLKNVDDLDRFMLVHGEKLVDSVGEQTKRIETIIKQQHPEVRHVDLEAIGRGK